MRQPRLGWFLVVDAVDGREVFEVADFAAELPAGPDGALVRLVAGEEVGPHERGGVELDVGSAGEQGGQGHFEADQPGAQAEGEEVQRALLDVGVGEAAAALAADQLGLDAEVAGDGGDVRAGGLQELAFFWGDADGLELGIAAEDGDVAAAPAAAIDGCPPFFEFPGLVGRDGALGGDDPGGDAAVAEELGGELLGGEAEADGLAGVADGGQAFHAAGGGEPADVPDAGRVDLLAVYPPFDGAVGDGHPDALRRQQLHLRGQEAGPGAVDDQAVAVATQQEGLQRGVEEVREGPAGGGCPEDRGEVREGILVAAAVGGEGEGADAAGDQVDACPDGRVLHGRGRGDRHGRIRAGRRHVADVP